MHALSASLLQVLLPLSLFLLQVAAFPLRANSSESIVKRATFPDYVLTYAPFAHFHSQERWFSSDITTHLEHTTPQIGFTNVADAVSLETLSSVSPDAYLTSRDNVETDPAWLLSTVNIPDSNRHSAAPGTIIVVEKPGGILDAFYFFFYSFNKGPPFLGLHWGNHVGDWEHTMIRFINGVPQNIYLSAHSGGHAYTFNALQSIDGRPVVYIATGSHANYATAGRQEYLLPFGLLADNTDAGPLWDVTQNFRGYWYDSSSRTFTDAGGVGIGGDQQASESTNWLSWLGRWGDERYPTSDRRQFCFFNIECFYSNGPTGPLDKNLGRTALCQNENDCPIDSEISQLRVSVEQLRAAGLDEDTLLEIKASLVTSLHDLHDVVTTDV